MKRKWIIGVVIVLILALGLIVGIFLVQQKQIFKQQAATPTGEASVSITPGTASFQRNVANTVSIYFDTANIPISKIQLELTYSNLSADASNIQIDQGFLSSGNWSCPFEKTFSNGSVGYIDITCDAVGTNGFAYANNTLLATFSLTATQVPIQNPLIVSFNSQNSFITKTSDGTDTLLIPASTGSYTITDTIGGSGIATATPTPTGIAIATATPTSTGSATPFATNPPIPVTGFDTPTILAGAGGVILLIISAAALIL